MAVFRRGKFYYFEFIYNGERIKVSTKQKNRRAAEDMESAYRTNLAKGELDILERKAAPLFTDAMKNFLSWSKENHAEHPNTHKRYDISSKPLLRFFGNARLDTITPEMVEKYKTSRLKVKSEATKRLLKPATINRELACLKIIFNYFIKLDAVVKNPVSRVKFLQENNEQMRVLGVEEQRLYLAAASQPLHDVAVLMLETGMRCEEVYCLKGGSVNLNEGFLQVDFGKTKAARRKIPLTDKAKEVLEKRMKAAKGIYLFPHLDDPNKPLIKVNRAHTGALTRSKVSHFRLYDLRHTFASRAAMSGVDLVTLAALLGHSRLQMVMRYAHPTKEHQVNAMRKIQEFVTAQEKATFTQSTMVN